MLCFLKKVLTNAFWDVIICVQLAMTNSQKHSKTVKAYAFYFLTVWLAYAN